MRIDRDVAIAMDDGIVLRADLFIPIEDGEYRPSQLRAVREGPRLSGGLSAAMGLHAREVPRGGQGHQQPAPELGSGRPGAVGAGRVCLRSGRLQGDRPIPGLHGPLVGPGDGGPLRLHRMGRNTAVEQRASAWPASRIAMNQYQVAALQPPHLAAICPWEGASDWYREFARHGGSSASSPKTGTRARSRTSSTASVRGAFQRGDRWRGRGRIPRTPRSWRREGPTWRMM